MWTKVGHGWRVIGTGMSFAVFMVGGVFLAFVIFPACRLFSRDPQIVCHRVQRMISRSFRLHLLFMRCVGVLKQCRFSGLERVSSGGPFIIVANHPTLIDIVALISRLPEIDCVVKRRLWDHPFMGGAVKAADYIPNDEGTVFLEVALDRLRQGRSVILFPEGTRSPAHGLRRFHRGAAHLALQAGAKIVPVVIRCDPPTLMKGQHWWEVPERPLRLRLQFGTPEEIPLPSDSAEDRPNRVRTLTHTLEKYFRSKLNYVGA